MRHFSILLLSALCTGTVCAMAAPVAAQVRQFPYEAVVVASETNVRSGPGQKYYPTDRLPNGAKVVVHRHDPGGWAMITPPPGSFSWIRSQYVRKTADGRGELTENDVVVRVGSSFGDVRDVEQRRLSKGDTVQILEEKTLAGDQGPVAMLRIVPPRGEYRWITSRDIVPADDSIRTAKDRDPYQVPSIAKREPPARTTAPDPFAAPGGSNGGGLRDRPLVKTGSGGAPGGTNASSTQTVSDADRLHAVDVAFRDMIAGDARTWRLDDLQAGYEEIGRTASDPTLAGQVGLRLDAIARYQAIKAEYDEFVRLTTETNRRDSQLLSMTTTMRAPGGAPAAVPATDPSIPSGGTSVPPGASEPGPVFGTTPDPVSPAESPVLPANPSSRLPTLSPQIQPVGPQGPGTNGTPSPNVSGPWISGPYGPPASGPNVGSPANPALPSSPGSANPPVTLGSPNLGSPSLGSPSLGSPSLGPATIETVPGTPTGPRTGPSQPGGFGPPGSSPQTFAPRPMQPLRRPAGSPFSGAGIVQRSVQTGPGIPLHVLVAPGGRILAYLFAEPGVQLPHYLGRSVGVIGERSFRQDLQADLIRVRGLVPVQIQADPLPTPAGNP